MGGDAGREDEWILDGTGDGNRQQEKDITNSRSLVPESVPPSSEELDPDEPTRSPLPRLPVRDTEVISDR
jgi:hypothetical protein